MILKSLELENIRSYKKQEIVFEKGINFLSGDIGSGKSTILLAIEFALFGFKKGDLEGFHLLRKGEREASIKLIIKTENSDIEIYRKIKKGKSNDVISQENGYIKFNDNLIELAPSEINAEVFELLNFPKDFLTKDKNLIYRFTIYTAQEQLKEIIFAENDKRLEVIRKIFNIDKYKQLKDAISIYTTKLREDKKILAVKLEPLSNLSDEIILLEKNIEIVNEEIIKILDSENLLIEKIKKYEEGVLKRDEYIEKLSEKVILIEKKLSQIEEIEKNNLELEKENNNNNNKLTQSLKIQYNQLNLDIFTNIKIVEDTLLNNSINKQNILEKIKEFDELKIEKDISLKLLNEIETKKRIILTEEKNINLKNTQTKIEEILKKNTELKLNIEKDINMKNIYEKEKESYLKLKHELEAIFENLNNNKESICDALKLDNCPTCLQEVSIEHKQNLHLKIKQERDVNLKKKETIEKEIQVSIEKMKNYEIILKKLEKLNLELFEHELNLKNLIDIEKNEKKAFENTLKLKTEILNLELNNPEEKYNLLISKLTEEKPLRYKIDMLNKDEIVLKESIFRLNSELKENNQKIKELENIKEKIIEIERKIAVNLIEIEKKQSYLDKLIEYRSSERKIRDEKIKITDILNIYKKEEKELNSTISSLKTKFEINKKLVQDKKEIIITLEKIKKTYEKVIFDENFLLNKAINITQIIEKTLFTKYYAEFCESFEMFFKELIEDNNIEIRLDDEFSPIIEQNGYDIDLKNLSGGEKSSLAIAYRLALKQIIETNLSSQKLSLLILDEPTDGFSREQIDRLGNILREIKLKQILIVSHDEKIENISDKIFYIEKINHESRIEHR